MSPSAEEDDWEVDPEKLSQLTEKYKGTECPLFASSLPDDWEADSGFAALHAILYGDQSAVERAAGFRQQGNELCADAARHKGERAADLYGQALACYRRGLNELTASPSGASGDGVKAGGGGVAAGSPPLEGDAEAPSDPASDPPYKEASLLHSNAAFVFLQLKKYAHCVDEARKAVARDSTNYKAFYRLARASCELELWRQGLDAAQKGLAASPGNGPLELLKHEIQQKLENAQRARARCSNREDGNRDGESLELLEAYKKRNLTLIEPGTLALYSGMLSFAAHGTSPFQIRHYLDESATLHWSALCLYPEVQMTDFIADLAENDSLDDHLAEMFSTPPPWDHGNRYKLGALAVYLEPGVDETLHEVPTALPCRQFLSKIRRVSKLLVFHIVVRNSPAHDALLEEHNIISLT